MVKVLVNGALGKMGHTVVQTVLKQSDMELVGAVDVFGEGKTVEARRWIPIWQLPWPPTNLM